MMDLKYVSECGSCTMSIGITSGGGLLKNASFPQSHYRHRKLEVLGWDLGIYLLKVLQGEAENVPFKANFWH